MAKYEECVEWGFADVTRLWGSLDNSLSQHFLWSLLGKQYHVCVLLTNIYICFYGSETSFYFNYTPSPSAKKRFTSGGGNPRPEGLRPPYASRAP